MLSFKGNLQVAFTVLSCVEQQLNSDDDVSLFHVECYANGREHGFAIKGYGVVKGGFGVAFSENRNSDSIVVYVGKYNDFGMAGNVPSEDVYRASKHFAYNEIYEAARLIVEKVRAFIAANKEAEAAVS